MSAEKLGDDFTLNYTANAVYATPTWTAQTSIGDLGFDFAREQVEIPKRISTKVYKGGRMDWELSFTMNYDANNTFHTAVRSAIEAGSKVHLALADGNIATNTTHYWHAWWILTGNLDAGLDNAASIEVKGKCHHDTGTADADIPAAATI